MQIDCRLGVGLHDMRALYHNRGEACAEIQYTTLYWPQYCKTPLLPDFKKAPQPNLFFLRIRQPTILYTYIYLTSASIPV